MSDRTLKLLLVDQDPIFRTGLRVIIEQFPDLQVVAEAETGVAALQILLDLDSPTVANASIPSLVVDLVVLGLNLSPMGSRAWELKLCRQLKTQYPNLPILLLTSLQEPAQLAAARAAGADGYCRKGTAISQVVAAIRQVAVGHWVEAGEDEEKTSVTRGVAQLRRHLRLSGLRQIDATLAEVTARLQVPGLPLLDQAILAGHRRELLAARWLVNQLLPQPEGRSRREFNQTTNLAIKTARTQRSAGGGSGGCVEQAKVRSQPLKLPSSLNTKASPEFVQIETSSQENFRVQAALFKSTIVKLQSSLENLTSVPLEIDIFREEKKRELLYLILQKIENVLDELRFAQVEMSQLPEIKSVVMRDLWQTVMTDFFGKYSMLRVAERNLEVVNLLLQDAAVVQTAILDKIPLFVDLFSYLLFETPLMVDNVSCPADSPEALERAEFLLDNLLIQLANGVGQPLLNKLADVEVIKQNFYDRRLISTREIERFRNSLSWRYRVSNYVTEPKAIFESRYDLFVFASRGIAKISIYAPRNQELAQLSGIQLGVTLALETRDAIAPRLRAAVAFLGSGFVYILTQVIGRAIGLIGRGILQGIGTARKS